MDESFFSKEDNDIFMTKMVKTTDEATVEQRAAGGDDN